ncbi:RelA/SpoT domain-containing protein [Delftia acidovorans]|uniref:RelA/SpoT domain-containing protein n=1 Tax=Delftia acidovorans TaxID=80866 RepID=A0AAJ2R1W2_DELAC|nr:RelA/SpoT domain-containing protein [Delftia acidovorans]MDX4953808.1 RelA/SpoT domain-containing protein [Delftia acidovorans]
MQPQVLTDSALKAFDDMNHELSMFMSSVRTWFETHPILTSGSTPLVHSVKSRIKNREHLQAKIQRKSGPDHKIDESNLGQIITDLSGVRVLHLHQEQLAPIHKEILKKIDQRGDWFLHEPPRAYTWDPERSDFYKAIGFTVYLKPSSYTSVHYTVRPRQDSQLCCEIQVRTLFEEIWGEVDHALNYPNPTDSVACREQLLVLGKVVGAGSRLVDSIYRTVAAVPTPTLEQAEQPNAPEKNAAPVVHAPVVMTVAAPDTNGEKSQTANESNKGKKIAVTIRKKRVFTPISKRDSER